MWRGRGAGEPYFKGEYELLEPLAFRKSRKERFQSMRPHAAQLHNEAANFLPVALLLCLQDAALGLGGLAPRWLPIHRIPDPIQLGQIRGPPARPFMVLTKKLKEPSTCELLLGTGSCHESLVPVPAPSQHSTTHKNSTAFAIASAADNNVPNVPQPRAV